MAESNEEADVVKFAKEWGIKTYKLEGTHSKGKPDRLFMKNSKAVFIEMKDKDEKPDPLQRRELRALRKMGFAAEYFDNAEQAIQFLSVSFALKGLPPLSNRQEEVFLRVVSGMRTSEIAADMGTYPSQISGILRVLAKRGYIENNGYGGNNRRWHATKKGIKQYEN